jgi:hypothetical protein
MCSYTDNRAFFLQNLAIGDTVLYGDIGDSYPWRVDAVVSKVWKKYIFLTLPDLSEVKIDRATGYSSERYNYTKIYPSEGMTAEEWKTKQAKINADYQEQLLERQRCAVGSSDSTGAIRIV